MCARVSQTQQTVAFLVCGENAASNVEPFSRISPRFRTQTLHSPMSTRIEVSHFQAGTGKALSPSPMPISLPVAHFAAAQSHVGALGLAHRHPLAGLDRVDPNLRHGPHLLQLPAPPGTHAAPGHGPQRHGGQSQRGDAEPGGPRLPGETETSQSGGASGTHAKLLGAGLGFWVAVARRGLRLRDVWEEPELAQPHCLGNVYR